MKTPVNILFGTRPETFEDTFKEQQRLIEGKLADRNEPDYLLLVEHQPVYTVGRLSPKQTPPGLAQAVPWIETNRGGYATFHGPGQVVAYPIFDLTKHGQDVHRYLRLLEQVVIDTLANYDIFGIARPGLTGVWVACPDDVQRKIASIGVGVKRWISFHGLALNVTTDLSFFRAISPCELPGEMITSMGELLHDAVPSWDDVAMKLARSFQEVFQLQEVHLGNRRRPSWLRAKVSTSPSLDETKEVVKQFGLNTVCEEAKCPNLGECWSHRTATFMIMGDECTRRCSFCSVKDGTLGSLKPLDVFEPLKVGQAVAKLGLKHAVVTSVDRDDLPDLGVEHFAKTVRAIKHSSPECAVELLIPDFRGKKDLLSQLMATAGITVLNHNVETVPRLYRAVRPGASFTRSLNILKWAKELCPGVLTKSGLMVGLGEEREEVLEVLSGLYDQKVDIVTIGQYLRPTEKQLPVVRFVTPEEFAEYRESGLKMGFMNVEAGPLVRSSYHAWRHVLKGEFDQTRADTGLALAAAPL